MTTASYAVTGMTCGYCMAEVMERIRALVGVTGVAVDLVRDRPSPVVVASGPAVRIATVREAVGEAGFDLTGEWAGQRAVDGENVPNSRTPALTDVVPADGVSADELLALVAAVEVSSEHPLATAIVTGARERHVELVEATAFDSITGQGVRALVGGREVLVGNRRLLAGAGIDPGSLEVDAFGSPWTARAPCW